ncbi:sulfatase family protein [Paenibacillus sabuli]|nr:sulfatase [Paenibacillus sabuli]
MHTHDTGRSIEPYGFACSTPRLMAFARQGMLFRNAYCAGPTCSPSRSALMTGMSAHSCGMLGLTHRGFRLSDPSMHLASFLSRHGYDTVLCGVQHESDDPFRLGYQRRVGTAGPDRGPHDRLNALEASAFIRERHERPYFLSFGMFNTHRPFPEPSGIHDPSYVAPPFPLADCQVNRTETARFLTSLDTVDKCVGMVLDALESSGQMQDTLVIFTTDHGLAFPRMKCSLFDTGIGVSLMIRLAGTIPQGVVTDALVSQIDLFPTICEAAGLRPPERLQGTSLLPLAAHPDGRIRDSVFAEVNYHAAYEPMRCIRTERYKLISYYGDYPGPILSNMDDSASKQFLVDNGLRAEVREREQLFDLLLDPVERHNRVDHPEYAAVYADLSSQLQSWMRDTKDPLLSGAVPQPAGAIVTSVGAVRPTD